jgi:N-acetylneuraminic acid mutarotase
MNHTRYYHTASLLKNGKVLVIDGHGDGRENTAELYDPAIGTWITTGSMDDARVDHTASLSTNGKVLVTGGYDGVDLNTAELYDLSIETWTTTDSMNDV